MFGIDFSELVVCLLVALVVFGPERMPEVVRTVSLWVGRTKRALRESKEEIERQIGMDEVRKQLHTEDMMKTLDAMQDEIDAALNYERGIKPVAVETSALPAPVAQETLIVNNTLMQ